HPQGREVELRTEEGISLLTAAEGLPDVAAAAIAVATETQQWRRDFAEPARRSTAPSRVAETGSNTWPIRGSRPHLRWGPSTAEQPRRPVGGAAPPSRGR